MIEITIPKMEVFNSRTSEIIRVPNDITLQLEHSLISVKKWESKWHKPFLEDDDKTMPQIIDYIRCMTIGKPVDLDYYRVIPEDELKRVIAYIKEPMTATWFSDEEKQDPTKGLKVKIRGKEIITNEIIYYWMVTLNIPSEYQKWHLNQLLTLIKVVSAKNAPKKKLGKRESAMKRAELNKKRREMYNSKG